MHLYLQTLLLLIGAATISANGIAVNPAGAASSAAVVAAAAATATNPSTHNEASPASRSRNTRETLDILRKRFLEISNNQKIYDGELFATYVRPQEFHPLSRKHMFLVTEEETSGKFPHISTDSFQFQSVTFFTENTPLPNRPPTQSPKAAGKWRSEERHV